jgi:hypothetical protein
MLFKPTVIANSKISNAFKITGYARVQANYSDYSWTVQQTLGELMQPSIIISERRKRASDLDVLE